MRQKGNNKKLQVYFKIQSINKKINKQFDVRGGMDGIQRAIESQGKE